MTDRETVLARVRDALAADTEPAHVVPRGYTRHGRPPGSPEVVDLLIDRLLDYRALVRRTTPDQLGPAIRQALSAAGSVVIPAGLPATIAESCRADGRSVAVDGVTGTLSAAALDAVDAVVTTARVAIALSGTIILDGEPDQGRRAITLIPDHHVVVLRGEQVVETVPEAIAMLEPTRPLTMIAGPSATSDIELERVEGVHGPRTLEVVIVG